MQLKKVTSAVVRFIDEATTIQLNDLACDMPSERKFKDSGAMVAPCTIARTGIMQYRASECGAMFADRDPNSIVKIATLETDLFDKDSIESYRSAPITVNHPEVDVDISNAKELQKGNLDSVPFADGNQLSGTIVINDADTLKLIDGGLDQLSSGHTCTLVLADEGKEYDAYKTNIRANHVALVESGRAGTAKIADEAQVTEAETKLADVETKLADAETKLADTIKAKEVISAKLEDTQEKLADSEKLLEEANLKVSDEAIDKLVDARLVFVKEVATLSDMDVAGMSIAEAKRKVVAQLLDKDISNKSDTYVEARFEIALEDSDEASPMSVLLSKQVAETVLEDTVLEETPSEIARKNMIQRNSNKV